MTSVVGDKLVETIRGELVLLTKLGTRSDKRPTENNAEIRVSDCKLRATAGNNATGTEVPGSFTSIEGGIDVDKILLVVVPC